MPYNEGDTAGNGAYVYRSGGWQAVPGKEPGKNLTPEMQPPPPGISTAEDVKKTIAPAMERNATALMTAPTTLGDLGAQGISSLSSYLPDSMSGAVKKGADTAHEYLKPFTYPSVQNKIESSYNLSHPNDPLYYPQTPGGQFAEAGIGGIAAAAGGPLSIAKGLMRGTVGGIGRRLATGVGGALGGEAAGQTADAAGFDNLAGVARGLGDVAGAKTASEGPRKLVTPYPGISPAHVDMAKLLSKQPGDITTAGQFTGNPKLLQREGNLAPHAPDPYNNLGVRQPMADTDTLMGTMGVPPSVVQKQGATLPVIQQGKKDLGATRDTLEGYSTDPSGRRTPNTQAVYDPEFHQKLQDITNDYFRAKNAAPNPAAPTPVEQRIQQIYHSGPNSTAAGMNGDQYGQLRKDINSQIKGYVSGKAADPVEVKALSQLRDALDDNMERTLQSNSSPHAGKWKDNFQQMESADVLKQAAKGVSNPAGILDPGTVLGAAKKNPNSTVANLARAQSTVHQPLPAPNEPNPFISTMIGALTGHLTGGSPAEGAIAGTVSGPSVQKTLLRNPLTSAAMFSEPAQDYFKNQRWLPSQNTKMDPATVARLLALQKTETQPPQQ